MTLAAYRRLSLPEQVALLRSHGRLLAVRQEGGVQQRLYALAAFFVEAWHWTTPDRDDAVDLINSFQHLAGLDVWLEVIEWASGAS